MARAPFQVMVVPYLKDTEGQLKFLAFKRADQNIWQWIAGGGEGAETPLQAAKREAYEEAGILETAFITPLDSITSIPVEYFADHHLWGENIYVIPEYSFGIEANDCEIHLSKEHTESAWLTYADAQKRLKWDSNKTALWELNRRFHRSAPSAVADG